MKRKAENLVEEGRGGEEEGTCNHGVAWFRGPLIGKGGFGCVYLANLKKPKSRNRYFPSVMAVKSAEVSVSSSLQKEKQVFNHLNGCPFVIKCFGEETTINKNGVMFYNVMLEYASGGTLARLIKKSSSSTLSGGFGLPELDVRRYARSILEGIDYIHQQGYVHCDLKPENILLVPSKGGDFVAKIGDLGLARKAANGKKRRFDPYLRGTALYMAPESVVDHVQEPPSDIWAFGCIILEMLTGKPAWDLKPGSTRKEVLRKIGDRCALPKIPSELSNDGKGFLKGCLVRNPKFRLTSEMLLDHPFVSGLDRSELVEILDAEDLDWTVTLSETDDESSNASSFSRESNSASLFSSWLDGEEINSTTSSIITTGDTDAFTTLSPVLSNPVQQNSAICTIPAGV